MLVAFSYLLSRQITFIPQVLSSYFGKFYSNVICNGCTWLFIIWYIIHCGLDCLLNEAFVRMKFKEFDRARLKNSLWYLGFYATAFVYTVHQSRFDGLGMKRDTNGTTFNDVGSEEVLGFMVLFSFFLHSALWEATEYDSKVLFLSYILLCGVFTISFILRSLEVAYTLTALISLTQILIQSAKLLFVLMKRENFYLRMVISIFFGFGVCSFCLCYLIGVPLVFLIPFCRKIFTTHLSSSFIPLTLVICGWYVSEIGNSPLFKLLSHWLFHKEESEKCCGNLVECSLFPQRNDITFNMLQLRRRIKEREERKLSLRRTSKKGALAQTIKCMVSLKRKIHAKRSAAMQETNVPAEKQQESDNETSKLLTNIENNCSDEKKQKMNDDENDSEASNSKITEKTDENKF